MRERKRGVIQKGSRNESSENEEVEEQRIRASLGRWGGEGGRGEREWVERRGGGGGGVVAEQE